MRIFNPIVWRNKTQAAYQIIGCVAFITISLVIFGHVTNNQILDAIGMSSLAASTTLLFATPRVNAAMPKHIIGGYLIGIVTGIIFHNATPGLCHMFLNFDIFASYEICSIFAIITAMITMVVIGIVHPPAVGLSLGLVLEVWNPLTIYVIFCAAMVLGILSKLFKHRMINLI